MSKIELVITPKEKDIGDNFVVRRSLPDRKKRMVGPFIFWDHMGPVTLDKETNMTVRAHPHIGLATITWLFSGEIMHRDTLGNEQPIRPGEVNWMTAGSGIAHSERAYGQEKPSSLEGIQLWLALPKESEDVEASFFHCKESEVPLIKEEGVSLRLIAGEAFGKTSPVPVFSKLFYLHGYMRQGKTFSYEISKEHEGAIYIVNGKVKVEEDEYSRFQLVAFKKGESIEFEATTDVEIMVFGGEIFPEKRYMWWNFVSTSQEKIEEAKKRWKNQEFGQVINEEEFTPLPEN